MLLTQPQTLTTINCRCFFMSGFLELGFLLDRERESQGENMLEEITPGNPPGFSTTSVNQCTIKIVSNRQ